MPHQDEKRPAAGIRRRASIIGTSFLTICLHSQNAIRSFWEPLLSWKRIARPDPYVNTEPFPISMVNLTREAYMKLRKYYHQLQEEAYASDDLTHSIITRQRELCSRFVFALHYMRSAELSDSGPVPVVDSRTVDDAICIFEALREHSCAVWQSFSFQEKQNACIIGNADFHVLQNLIDLLEPSSDDLILHNSRITGVLRERFGATTSMRGLTTRLKNMGFKKDRVNTRGLVLLQQVLVGIFYDLALQQKILIAGSLRSLSRPGGRPV